MLPSRYKSLSGFLICAMRSICAIHSICPARQEDLYHIGYCRYISFLPPGKNIELRSNISKKCINISHFADTSITLIGRKCYGKARKREEGSNSLGDERSQTPGDSLRPYGKPHTKLTFSEKKPRPTNRHRRAGFTPLFVFSYPANNAPFPPACRLCSKAGEHGG